MTPQGIGVVGPDGFTYQDQYMHKAIVADGFVELVIALEGYRIANGITVGDPRADVEAHLARSQQRNNEPDPHLPQAVQNPQTLRDRVTSWLANKFGGAAAGTVLYCAPEEAERRAGICVGCPQNKTWKVGCPPCVANNERVILLLTKGQVTSQRDKLLGCNICGHDNGAAVVLDRKELGSADRTPAFCWMNE